MGARPGLRPRGAAGPRRKAHDHGRRCTPHGREVAEHLINHVAVLLDLSTADTDIAKRILDFSSGVVEHTCEACGEPGRIRLRGDGPRVWMQAGCGNCRVPA
ncbi:cell division protein SepF [Streptomyces sp. HC44]|uniref:Cell division protein SepF n=1 Tax=Streptomyces scabichelini TaxID=2711217 RepID=A0A6G4UXX4_9ACTN|nr:cell division protein SepF [Streptomyces scabichelini]